MQKLACFWGGRLSRIPLRHRSLNRHRRALLAAVATRLVRRPGKRICAHPEPQKTLRAFTLAIPDSRQGGFRDDETQTLAHGLLHSP